MSVHEAAASSAAAGRLRPSLRTINSDLIKKRNNPAKHPNYYLAYLDRQLKKKSDLTRRFETRLPPRFSRNASRFPLGPSPPRIRDLDLGGVTRLHLPTAGRRPSPWRRPCPPPAELGLPLRSPGRRLRLPRCRPPPPPVVSSLPRPSSLSSMSARRRQDRQEANLCSRPLVLSACCALWL